MAGDTLESILRRYIDTHRPDLMFSDPDNERIQELADKCTEGQLTEEERREYKAYMDATHLMGLMQARAQQALTQHAPAR